MKLHRVIVGHQIEPATGKVDVYGPISAEAVDVSGRLYVETFDGLRYADDWRASVNEARREAAARLEQIGLAVFEQARQLREEAARVPERQEAAS